MKANWGMLPCPIQELVPRPRLGVDGVLCGRHGEYFMQTRATIVAAVIVVALTIAVPCSAFERCFSLGNFGNEYRIEFTEAGNSFILSGQGVVFADRAVSGAAFFGVNDPDIPLSPSSGSHCRNHGNHH